MNLDVIGVWFEHLKEAMLKLTMFASNPHGQQGLMYVVRTRIARTTHVV